MVLIGSEGILLEEIPLLICGGYARVLRQLFHHRVDDGFQRRLQVAVLLFALDIPQPLGQFQHEPFDVWILQRTVFHLHDELPQHVVTLLGELVPALGLLTVNLRQVLAEDFLCQGGLDRGDAGFVQEAGPAVGAPADHVDVRVVRFIVEGGVPAELAVGDFHRLRHLRCKAGEQFPPLFCVVVAKAGGVLPAQGDNREPDVAWGAGHRLRHLCEIDRAVAAREETMRAGTHGPGTFGDVVYITVPARQLQAIIFDCTGDELAGVPASRGGEVVAVLKQLLGGREVPQELFHHLLLVLCSGQGTLAGVDAFHTLTGGDVADIPLPLGGGILLGRFIRLSVFSPVSTSRLVASSSRSTQARSAPPSASSGVPLISASVSLIPTAAGETITSPSSSDTVSRASRVQASVRASQDRVTAKTTGQHFCPVFIPHYKFKQVEVLRLDGAAAVKTGKAIWVDRLLAVRKVSEERVLLGLVRDPVFLQTMGDGADICGGIGPPGSVRFRSTHASPRGSPR